MESIFHTFDLAFNEGGVCVFLVAVSVSSNVLVGVDIEGGLGDGTCEGVGEGKERCDGVMFPKGLVVLVGVEQAVLNLWGVSEQTSEDVGAFEVG